MTHKENFVARSSISLTRWICRMFFRRHLPNERNGVDSNVARKPGRLQGLISNRLITNDGDAYFAYSPSSCIALRAFYPFFHRGFFVVCKKCSSSGMTFHPHNYCTRCVTWSFHGVYFALITHPDILRRQKYCRNRPCGNASLKRFIRSVCNTDIGNYSLLSLSIFILYPRSCSKRVDFDFSLSQVVTSRALTRTLLGT